MRIVLALALSLLAACTSLHRIAVPEPFADDVAVAGYQNIRFWGDVEPPRLEERVAGLLDQLQRAYEQPIAEGATVRVSFLALSGGGGNGAFAAGLLKGWSQNGDRPSFRIVSGVSTGAIIAPFAFLGASHDEGLRRAYTETTPADIYTANVLPNLFSGPGLADTAPLEALIANFADETLLEAIAAEHALGRRLYVTTTNLDAGRPVVWDMGAIAASGHPEALDLFRRIILASASLPGIFPPVEIDVVHNGEYFTELHVDGGLTSQVFAYHPQVELGRILDAVDFEVEVAVYVIWNGRRIPAYTTPDPRWYDIVSRALDVQFNYQGLGDIRRIYSLTERDGARFYLAMIPDDYTATPDELFEQEYMRGLFAVGEAAAADENLWREEPP
jgi:hypothetical protein